MTRDDLSSALLAAAGLYLGIVGGVSILALLKALGMFR